MIEKNMGLFMLTHHGDMSENGAAEWQKIIILL